MTDEAVDGLRKAARRIFWEAGRIDASRAAGRRDALLAKAEHCERMAGMDMSDFRSIGRSDEWVAGFIDALEFVAHGIRHEIDEEDGYPEARRIAAELGADFPGGDR